MSQPILKVIDLHAGYDMVPVLQGLNLEVQPGSITALVGSNGAGKTTLMRAVSGLIPIKSGRVIFEGRELNGTKPSTRVDLGISLVPEGRMVFPAFTVDENLRSGAYLPRVRKRRSELVARMFHMFPRLHERRSQLGQTLSGGEQQMLALARGLMAEPKLLLLDEPGLGLAPVIVAQMFKKVVEARAAGMSILIVEQNVRATLDLADYAYVMENGAIVMSGPAAEIANDSSVQSAYFGL